MAGKRAPSGATKAGSGTTTAKKASAAKKGTATTKAATKAPATKTAAKKAPATKAAAKKAPATKAPVKKVPATKAAAKKAPATKAAAKNAPATKAAAKKAPATKAAAKKAPAAKAAQTKTAAAKAPANTASAVTAPTKAPAKKTTKMALVVRVDESPWTAKELREVRAEIEANIALLRTELAHAESELSDLLRDSGDGAGDDQADAGAKTYEREQEIALADNAREMLHQNEHALERLDDGTYGVCESCGQPIGKLRLQAAPRATLCMRCKTKQERR